ncbi:MAG: glycogen/starch synthase, partial [Candidatus Omnitrophica bacterium]|nr:glycogen/starch synthase [Candidatus Omnitrophota bacterium]
RLTNEPLPKKYFSGGFQETKINRSPGQLPTASESTKLSLLKIDVRSGSSASQAISLPANPAKQTFSPKAFYNGSWKEVANKELKKYLHNLQNPGADKVVSDVSLEAFLDPIKGPAQLALGKGGLGFLTGETWGAYSDLEHWKAMGVMPLYNLDKNGNEIDWDSQKGIQPVYVQDDFGRRSTLSMDIDFKGNKERVYIYWVNANGTPVFLIKHSTLFRKLYPGGEEQIIQYGFFGRAYVEMIKRLGISPSVLRLSEPQLIFVLTAMLNDVDFFRSRGEKSVFDKTLIAMTTHTPERAALPSWDNVEWLKKLVGNDLVRENIIAFGKINAAGAMAYLSDMINGVSPEHRDITREAVLPAFADKTTGIQNGSEPHLWRSEALNDLILDKGIANITGQELFDIGKAQKSILNAYLTANGFSNFSTIDRPLFAAVRRLVEYKSQAILIPMVKWIVGDPDKEFDTPIGPMKGLGSNLLLGGEALDDITPEWMKQFKALELDPEVRGRFVMAERTTGTEFMQLATSSADGWLVMPWLTREASGTSDQRAGLNGHLVIATATGGPVEWIDHGSNGWLVTPFKFEHYKRNMDDAKEFHRIIWAFQNKEVWALTHFYEEGRRQFAMYMNELITLYRAPGREKLYKAMELSFQAAHRRVTIHRMVQEYGIMFNSIVDGVGVKGFEQRLKSFGEKWDLEKRWQKEGNSLEFDTPQIGKQLPLLINIDGFDDFEVSLRRGSGNFELDLVTDTGILPIKSHSDLYIIHANDKFHVALKATPEELVDATWLRFRALSDNRMKLDVVRSGAAPVKLTIKDASEITGGIDVRNIQVNRQGQLQAGAMTNTSLEQMILSAPAIQGFIVSISPVKDLAGILK